MAISEFLVKLWTSHSNKNSLNQMAKIEVLSFRTGVKLT